MIGSMRWLVQPGVAAWLALSCSLFPASLCLQSCKGVDDLPEAGTYMNELLFSVDCLDGCSCSNCDTVSFEVDAERCGLYIVYELGCSWSPGGHLSLFGPEGEDPLWSHRVSCFGSDTDSGWEIIPCEEGSHAGTWQFEGPCLFVGDRRMVEIYAF